MNEEITQIALAEPLGIIFIGLDQFSENLLFEPNYRVLNMSDFQGKKQQYDTLFARLVGSIRMTF